MVTGTVTHVNITSVDKLKAKCTKASDNEIEVEVSFKTSLLPGDVHKLLMLMQGSVPVECAFHTNQSRMNI